MRAPKKTTNPRPLVDFGSEFFNDYDFAGMVCNHTLPFVSKKDDLLWSTPDFEKTGIDPIYFGIRSAAAWAVMVGHKGIDHHPSLSAIAASEEFQAALAKESEEKSAAEAFLDQIQILIWSLNQYFPPAKIVEDAHSHIAMIHSLRVQDDSDPTTD